MTPNQCPGCGEQGLARNRLCDPCHFKSLNEDNKLKELIMRRLTISLGREPTEDEVQGFIYGNRYTRLKIWNKGIYSNRRANHGR